MTVVAPPVGGPSLRDAGRAAEVLADAGVAVVLLYGSVARGDQHADSDIDLVAVLDDLDYSTRWHRRCELERLATGAAGRRVEVFVTDRPEWEHRTSRVATSFEAGIADDAVVLCDRPPDGVRWTKEIGMPASDFDEAVASLRNTNQALGELRDDLEPGGNERDERAAGDAFEYSVAVAIRLRGVCSRSQSALENALKALIHLFGDDAPGKLHALDELLAKLPDPPRRAVAAILEGLDLPVVSEWRKRGTYPADYPEISLPDLVLAAGAFASVACALSRLAARHVAETAPAAEVGALPAPGTPAREAARAARRCAGIEQILAGWDFTRETPTAQMAIPEPPELPGPRG